jgi:TRAP-type C4-dicarboxylate transport system permease small subunit
LGSLASSRSGNVAIVMFFIAFLVIISFMWLILNGPMEIVLTNLHYTAASTDTKDFLLSYWQYGMLIVMFVLACIAFLVWFVEERG